MFKINIQTQSQYIQKPSYKMQIMSFHPAVYDNITPESIRTAALHTQGAAGPSGLDATSWRRVCTAFGQRSNDLCAAIAAVGQRISTTFIDPCAMLAYTSCRLVPLVCTIDAFMTAGVA